MEEGRFVALSVLLALVWGGTVLAWLLHAAKDRARRVSTLVMLGFALAFGPIAFSKNGDPPLRSGAAAPSPPVVSLLLAEVRTNAVFDLSMPSNAVAHGPWLRRGASDDWFWFHSTNDLFRAGTNAFRSVRVSSRGTLAFPGGSRLEPFHAVLGVLPEPSWTNAPSRFWQAPTVGGGHLFTWEGAALDRDSATPGSFQAELLPDGGMVGRYDLPHPATNFVIAALGETALSVRGDVTNAAAVRRANGAAIPETSLAELLRDATRFELVWRAAEGGPDADPDGDGLTTRDEIGRHGTDPKQADTDGDGLSDASEILLGSNPLDADEDGDGIPDGVASTDWTTNALWAANATNASTSIAITLNAAIPAGASASLVVDDLCIPLRTPATWTLALVPGRLYTYRLNANGAAADLSVSLATNTPPLRSSPGSFPFWTEGSGDVFDGPSDGGSGHMAVPTLELSWIDPGDGSHEDGGSVGLHEENAAAFQCNILPSAINWISGLVQTAGFNRIANTLYLPLGPNDESVSGTIGLNPDRLRWGSVSETRSAHRCSASPENPYCIDCGHYLPVDICLSVSKDILTLKHDNQTSFSIVHTNSIGETHTNGMIEIRYKNGDGEWWVLGNESELQPWTARFPGAFEARGKLDFNGNEWTTPVRDLTVQFPSVDDIRFDPSVIQRAELEWRATLDDCSTNWGWTRERGYWIALDTQTSSYAAMNPTNGDWFSTNAIDGVNLGARPPDLWSDPDNHQAGAIYVVASFHTHPPTAAWPVGGEPGRPVGPSEDGDLPITAARRVPGLVFDYEADTAFSENNHTNGIPAGWPTNAPARIYPVTPPVRRPLP